MMVTISKAVQEDRVFMIYECESTETSTKSQSIKPAICRVVKKVVIIQIILDKID